MAGILDRLTQATLLFKSMPHEATTALTEASKQPRDLEAEDLGRVKPRDTPHRDRRHVTWSSSLLTVLGAG